MTIARRQLGAPTTEEIMRSLAEASKHNLTARRFYCELRAQQIRQFTAQIVASEFPSPAHEGAEVPVALAPYFGMAS